MATMTVERKKAVEAIQRHIDDLFKEVDRLTADIFAGGKTAETVARRQKDREYNMAMIAGLKMALTELEKL